MAAAKVVDLAEMTDIEEAAYLVVLKAFDRVVWTAVLKVVWRAAKKDAEWAFSEVAMWDLKLAAQKGVSMADKMVPVKVVSWVE